jgi:D-sedoheptulose 7-phosphate isomerase
MRNQTWSGYVNDCAGFLNNLSVRDEQGNELDVNDGFAQWVDIALTAKKSRKVVYFCGNGASASMGSHFSADLAKNGLTHTQVLIEPSLTTAIGNDISFDDVFSFPLSVRGNEGDVLITISSSGNSPNVVKAITMAKSIGMKVITVSGLKEDNTSRKSGHLNFYLPATTYGTVEATHGVLLHHWMDFMELHKND